jgi:hypothetical protein
MEVQRVLDDAMCLKDVALGSFRRTSNLTWDGPDGSEGATILRDCVEVDEREDEAKELS